MENSRPVGRPTDYDPEWVKIVPDMFKDGQSIVEVAVDLGISRAALYRYMDEHEEFRDSITRGRELSQAWWERQARDGLYKTSETDPETKIRTERTLNDRLWMNNVRFRFPDDYMEKKVLGTDNEEKSPMRVIVDHTIKIEDCDTVEIHRPTVDGNSNQTNQASVTTGQNAMGVPGHI